MDSQGRAAGMPRYLQISEALVRDIAAGRLVDGMRLPPERAMAADLGVSVGTLRKSLADLEERGLLGRVQGSGNYIREGAKRMSQYSFFRLELPGRQGQPTAEVLSVDRCAKEADMPPFGRQKDGHRIRRLRHLDGTPVALEEIWLDGGAATEVAKRDLDQSLYQFYRDALGVVVARVEDRLGAARFPSWTPNALAEKGALGGYIERLSWDETGASIEFSRTWFNADRCAYVSRLGKG